MPTITTTLPKFTWPAGDCSQARILAKLQEYFAWKRSKLKTAKEKAACEFPFPDVEKLCSGLTIYWLYCKRTGAEWEFIHNIEYLLNWTPNIVPDDKITDKNLEGFINIIEFLQNDVELRNGIEQENIDKSLATLLPSYMHNVSAAEFSVSFVFDRTTLTDLLQNAIHANKMIYLSNGRHSIGVLFNDGKYFIYDPAFSQGAISFHDTESLAKEIFLAFGANNQSYISLHMSVFDLEYAKDYLNEEQLENSVYPNPIEYCQNLLNIPEYCIAVIEQPGIAAFLVRYNQAELLESLTRKGLDIDFAPQGEKPLAWLAINQGGPEVLFWLLANGADLYIEHERWNLFALAAYRQNKPALVLLLAFGYELPKDLTELHKNFTRAEIKDIFLHAISLNQRLLNSPPHLDLNAASPRDIVMFLRNALMKLQLLKSINDVQLTFNGITLNGINAIKQIGAYFKQNQNNDLFAIGEKTEIYALLKKFNNRSFKFTGSRELIKLIDQVKQDITKLNIEQISPNDLLEIALIIDELSAICNAKFRLTPSKIRLRQHAKAAKNAIETYLRRHGITDIHAYTKKMQQNHAQRNYMFFTPKAQGGLEEIPFASIANHMRFDV